MAGSLDMVASSIGSSLDFAAKNFKALAVQMGRIYLLDFSALLVFGVLAAIVIVLAGGISAFSGANLGAVLAFVIGFAIILFSYIVVSGSIVLVKFAAIESVQAKGGVKIIGNAGAALWRYAAYLLIMGGAAVVVVGIPLVAGFGVVWALGTNSAASWIAAAACIAIAVVAWLAVSLLAQFSTIDIMVNRRGPVEAIRRSVALVRKNLVPVIIYDIAVILISFAIGLVFGIVNEVLSFGISLGVFNVALLVVMVGIYLLVIFAESVLVALVITPIQYFFWKALGGKG